MRKGDTPWHLRVPDCSLGWPGCPVFSHRADLDPAVMEAVEKAYRRGVAQTLWVAARLLDELGRREPAACGPRAGELLRLAFRIAQGWRHDRKRRLYLLHELKRAVRRRKRWPAEEADRA